MTHASPSKRSDERIVLAAPSHLASLGKIERRAAALFPPEDLPPEERDDETPIDELLAAQRAGLLWVAETRSGEPVGFARVSLVAAGAHLEEMDVLPEHGRRGLGTRLLRAVIGWARREAVPWITLTTYSHLPWNAPFYARHGFEIVTEAELDDRLRGILDQEGEDGLRRELRVAMRRVAD